MQICMKLMQEYGFSVHLLASYAHLARPDLLCRLKTDLWHSGVATFNFKHLQKVTNMKIIPISVSFAALFTASTGLATPILAISDLNMTHSWVINGGNSPEGITINNLSNTLVINSDAQSAVDDPAATQTDNSNFVVGNPFSDPVIPVQSERDVITTLPSLTEGALARYEYSIRVEDDPDPNEFDIISREIAQMGAAVALIDTAPVAASASSSHFIQRFYRFDNTSSDTISFNIAGSFEADLNASYDGLDGFARTSGGFDMLFDVGFGSSVQHFAVGQYLRTIEDSAPGATVSEQLLLNSGGITGMSFGASTTAIGDGGLTEASLEAENRYIFGITVDSGASLLMRTNFRQSNSVDYRPQPIIVPTVPLPASALMLVFGMLSLVGFRRRA